MYGFKRKQLFDWKRLKQKALPKGFIHIAGYSVKEQPS